jgi:hypothetical protein
MEILHLGKPRVKIHEVKPGDIAWTEVQKLRLLNNYDVLHLENLIFRPV